MSLKAGDKAPAFSGSTQEGQPVALADYAGKMNVFLVFYPKAFSPVCTDQLSLYSGHLEDFKERGTEVIAVSVDNAFSQKAFCDALGGVQFPVLSDMTLEIARSYGVALPGGFANRAEFLIDKQGNIRWLNIEKSAGDNTPTMDDIFGAIDKLKK
ncbi:MAG: redoxin domain-containing protein [Fidelibacterota bacterium]|nr:MAG: redoxin domain-containing protein [Candidatus Neomarinimicrobiota bacterium]